MMYHTMYKSLSHIVWEKDLMLSEGTSQKSRGMRSASRGKSHRKYEEGESVKESAKVLWESLENVHGHGKATRSVTGESMSGFKRLSENRRSASGAKRTGLHTIKSIGLTSQVNI